jgi:hypothetical protein
MERQQLLDPLGFVRLRILECLGGNDRHAAGYFPLDVDQDVFLAFREHIERLSDAWSSEKDPLTRNLLAAGRLVIGDIDAANDIFDRIPHEVMRLDHSAGVCVVAPFATIAVVLPLPTELRDRQNWQQGSPTLDALRRWIRQHHYRLLWAEAEGVYRLF